ncbi:MAG TPA: hypothetical protein ENI76_08100 [Ignavibacteria bacterium]|nr:hypothetical protein [Ignavibacteria bacterium]
MSLFLHQINPVYFWDVNLETLDEEKSKRLIIDRIATLGNLREIEAMINFYGEEEVVKILCNLNYLDQKTLNFFSFMFKIPKTQFKCYTRRLLTQQPWS